MYCRCLVNGTTAVNGLHQTMINTNNKQDDGKEQFYNNYILYGTAQLHDSMYWFRLIFISRSDNLQLLLPAYCDDQYHNIHGRLFYKRPVYQNAPLFY